MLVFILVNLNLSHTPDVDVACVNSKMRRLLALLFTLTGGHCEAVFGPQVVTGSVGHAVTIPCGYAKPYRDRVKYWCAGRLQSKCVKTASTDGSVKDSRVSIRDEKLQGVFNVTIASLVKKDTGWYQCGVTRDWAHLDYRHKVYLNVSMGSESGLDPAVPSEGGLQTSPVESITIESRFARVWAVGRWCLFSMMLACFLTVTWLKRSASRESVPPDAFTLQESN